MNKKLFAVIALLFAVIAFSAMPVFAETHTKYVAAHPATDPGAGAKGVYYQSGIIDCNNTTYFSSGVTNGDVVQIVNVPINTIVKWIGIRTTRAAIVSGTSAEVGDGTDIDGFIGHTYTNPVPFVDLSKAQSGMSIWGAMHQATYVSSGVSVNSNGTYVSNLGPFFANGVSPYVGRDTIDMTVYVNAQSAASGVTPKFEYMIECIKLPTSTQ